METGFYALLIIGWEVIRWAIIALVLIVPFAFLVLLSLFLYDRWFQGKNLVYGNFPVIGRMRYLAHELRPFFRQYFGDDNAWTPRIIIDWILDVASGKSGYFAFDKFDTTAKLHDGHHQMVHSPNPLNVDEMEVEFPLVGAKRQHPFQLQSFFYRSAMSLGALGFEATAAMAAACADAHAPFNTGEGGFSVHHIPRVKFSKDRKFFKYTQVPAWLKPLYFGAPGARLKTYVVDLFGALFLPKGMRDLYLFDKEAFVFYTIDWEADLKHFPKPEELHDEFGQVIFQIGSGLYGLRKHTEDGKIELNWDRFAKVASFCRAIEIKLAQGAKQTGGILKANKNTPVIATIRGMKPGVDIISPNRFPFYEKDKEKAFLEFMDQLSQKAGGKPVGCKLVISDEGNIEPLAKAIKKYPKIAPDFITIDGGDGGSGAAPIALGVLFGKRIYEALEIANQVLEKHQVRDQVKVFASAKLYAPHMSARAMALGADAIGNARSIMISGGCIRAGLCSGEHGNCPVGMATMKKANRRSYAQAWDQKVQQIQNYIKAHNKGLIQVASICGVTSPSLLEPRHVANPASH
jgi:glutamate synthase domain-containing protein 2